MTEQWDDVPENPERDAMLPEDAGEREIFNRRAEQLGGPLMAVLSAIEAMQAMAPRIGSHDRYLAVMRNEVLKAHIEATRSAAREAASAEEMREACAAEHDEAAKRQAEPGPSIEFTSGFASAYEKAWASALRTLPIPHASALARAEKAAYQRGWNDRESDFLAGAERTGMTVVGPDALAAAEKRGMERAAEIARRVEIPGDCSVAEAHGRMTAALAAAEVIRNAAAQESEGC